MSMMLCNAVSVDSALVKADTNCWCVVLVNSTEGAADALLKRVRDALSNPLVYSSPECTRMFDKEHLNGSKLDAAAYP